MPGPFDYNNGISWMKYQNKYDSLYGLSVKDLLAEKLSLTSKSIRFLNDAESFLKGEVFSGAAKDTCNVIGLTLGTGLGSARYITGEVTDADLWHSPFLNGNAEDYLSARWFVGTYLSMTGKTVKGVKELAELANENSTVLGIFKEFGNNLSLFLKDIIYKYQPGMIVLGGSIADAFDLFYDQLYIHLNDDKPEIKKAILGEHASLIGAATCWNEIKILQNVRA
jgi:glucokinase